jgi:predicted transposase/invertase (TIGR01784 family)
MDVVFKVLFAAEKNRGLLIALLTAVLRPESPIASVEVLNPDDKNKWDAKGTLLDIRARFADGRWADVEMQARREGGLRRRALFYWARLYAAELGAGLGGAGEGSARVAGAQSVGGRATLTGDLIG